MVHKLTTAEVVSLLGGDREVAKLTNRVPTAPYNWRMRGVFPPELFLLMTQALHARGVYGASPSLWQMEEIDVDEVAARAARAARAAEARARAAEARAAKLAEAKAAKDAERAAKVERLRKEAHEKLAHADRLEIGAAPQGQSVA